MIPRQLIIGVAVLLLAVLGMSAYVWRMRGHAAAPPAVSNDTRPLAPPVAGPSQQGTLFVAHDEDGSLRPHGAQIPLPSGRQERAQELLRAFLFLYLYRSPTPKWASGAEFRSVS